MNLLFQQKRILEHSISSSAQITDFAFELVAVVAVMWKEYKVMIMSTGGFTKNM